MSRSSDVSCTTRALWHVARLQRSDAYEMPGALEGLLVVSVEQAVAAPYCAARLADAGARVIKIERPEGDFARGYDGYVHGLCSAISSGSTAASSRSSLDFKNTDDLALLHRMIGKADVLIQNLAPGAAERAGFGSAAMRAPRQAADHRRHLGLRRSRPLQGPPRLRSAGPGRERHGLDHRHRACAGPGRRLGDRHRHRHVRPRRRARGAAGAAEDRRGPRTSRCRCSPRWPSG